MSQVRDLIALVKPRITLMVVATGAVGLYLAPTTPKPETKLGLLLGMSLLVGGANALNMYLERDIDGRAERTKDRPLPAGRLEPKIALALSLALGVLALLWLGLVVNLLTAVLGLVAFVSYTACYTPMKQVSPGALVIGAVPGAMPPLMGWTAARGEIGAGGLGLFGILFLWQIPHFLAIAWLYREQYAKAGFRMLPVVDPQGRATGWIAFLSSIALLVTSLVPMWVGVAGVAYGGGALALGTLFAWASWRFTMDLDRQRARMVFFASIIYLPLLLGLLMADNVLQSIF